MLLLRNRTGPDQLVTIGPVGAFSAKFSEFLKSPLSRGDTALQ